MSERAEWFAAVGAGDLARVRELVGVAPSLVVAKDGGGGDVAWVRRFLTRLPALARCKDKSGKSLRRLAEESGVPEMARPFRGGV